MRKHNCKILIGINEWCSLPLLNTPLIKAKVDTGATTSAIHAYDVKPYVKNRQHWVRFTLHPVQNSDEISYRVKAPLVDIRYVTSYNGIKEKRYVIETDLCLGPLHYQIQLTLTNRDPMRFRMLLGCAALDGHVLVDPAESCMLGGYTREQAIRKYLGHNPSRL